MSTMFDLHEVKEFFSKGNDLHCRFVNWDDNVKVKSVLHDSRIAEKGSMYVAIKGERFNGHEFVEDVKNRGAAACIVERQTDVSIPQLVVDNSVEAYGLLASMWRNKIKYPVIAVTGSNGKTTTKELLFKILSGSRVYANKGNLNNLIGLPQSLLSFPVEGDFGILEMGMNALHEIEKLCKIAGPDLGVITNIGRAHIGRLGSVENIIKAKLELFDYISDTNGTVVVNISDYALKEWLDDHKEAKAYTFSIGKLPGTDLVFEYVSESDSFIKLRVIGKQERNTLDVPLHGKYNTGNIACAVAVALVLGIDLKQIKMQLSDFAAPSMRSQIVNKKGITFFLDCYNANPDSMKASLTASMKFNKYRRRIAVIGDMYELDGMEIKLHEELGKYIAGSNFDAVFLFGLYAGYYFKGINSSVNSLPLHISTYGKEDFNEFKKSLWSFIKEGDFVFIKGSRGNSLEALLL